MPDGPFSSTAPLFWLTPQWVKSRMLDRFEVVEPEDEEVDEVVVEATLAEWRPINGERGSRI